jgi:hypothetical protein
MNEEVKGRCSWCNGAIMERSSHIISMVTPKTLYCGRPCADAATRYERSLVEPLVVEQKQESGHCGTCRHWHIAESLGDIPCHWGECDAPSDALRVRTYSQQVQEMSQSVRARVTTSYWGCIQFEPRDSDA